MTRAILALLALALLGAGPKTDLDRLQGTWRVVREESMGKPHPVDDARWIVQGDQVSIIDRIVIRGELSLDATKTPARFERTARGTGFDEGTIRGIYRQEGDTLSFYMILLSGKEAPREFPDQPERGSALEVWRRFEGPPEKGLDGTWKKIKFQSGGGIAYGEDVPGMVKGFTLTIKGDDYIIKNDSVKHGILRLNPAALPREIDLEQTDGAFKGNVSPGIYRIEGDRLTTCFNVIGRRPVDFTIKPHFVTTLRTFERVLP